MLGSWLHFSCSFLIKLLVGLNFVIFGLQNYFPTFLIQNNWDQHEVESKWREKTGSQLLVCSRFFLMPVTLLENKGYICSPSGRDII